MIQNDIELQDAQERIRLFEQTLAEARKSYSPSNYSAMAEGYLIEIDKLQAEIREYLNPSAEQSVHESSIGFDLPVKAHQVLAKTKEVRSLSTLDEALVYILLQYAKLQDKCAWTLDLGVESESEKERKAS